MPGIPTGWSCYELRCDKSRTLGLTIKPDEVILVLRPRKILSFSIIDICPPSKAYKVLIHWLKSNCFQKQLHSLLNSQVAGTKELENLSSSTHMANSWKHTHTQTNLFLITLSSELITLPNEYINKHSFTLTHSFYSPTATHRGLFRPGTNTSSRYKITKKTMTPLRPHMPAVCYLLHHNQSNSSRWCTCSVCEVVVQYEVNRSRTRNKSI